jgi:hypothetical protein
MKHLRTGAIALALLAAAGGCQKTYQWQNLSSKEGRFSVQMPGTPQTQSQSTAGVTMTGEIVDLGDEAYTVMYGDLPPTGSFDLDKGVEGFVSGVSGTLVSKKEIAVDGNPGREFECSITKPVTGSASGRVILAGRRVYQVIAMGKGCNLNSPNVQKFVSSFKLEK